MPKDVVQLLMSGQPITEASVGQRFLLYVHARQHGTWIDEISGFKPERNQEDYLAK